MPSLKIAIGQMPALLHKTPTNIKMAVSLAERAAENGARLLLLPESCLTGYAIDEQAEQAVLEPTAAAFAELTAVARQQDITICAGFASAYADGINVAHAIIQPNGSVIVQRKSTRAATEPEFYRTWPDPARTVFEVDGIRIVVVICSEMGDLAVANAVIRSEAQLILHPSAGVLREDEIRHSPITEKEKKSDLQGMLQVVERAAEQVATTGRPRLAANPIGFDGSHYWPGNSYAIEGNGAIRIWLHGTCVPDEMQPAIGVEEINIPS